jgi:hypothetical protein
MPAPPRLTDVELATIDDPSVLLQHAWDLEPWARYAERTATLDRLQALLDADDAISQRVVTVTGGWNCWPSGRSTPGASAAWMTRGRWSIR